MRSFFILSVFAVIVLSAAVQAADFSVGVSPDVLDIGTLPKGEERIVKFSIFTVSDEPLLVYFDTENGGMDFFNKGYKHLMTNFSEEPTSAWVELLNDPVEIDTSVSKTVGRSWHDVSFLLKVPENAEPGYHIVQLRPRPVVYGGAGGAVGTNIVSVSSLTVIFNVEGSAERSGLILDTTASGYAKSDFVLKTPFRNTGSVTMLCHAANSIYAQDGALIGEFRSQNQYVKPGSTAFFETHVRMGMEGGEYGVVSAVDYATGEDTKNTTFFLAERPLTAKAVEEKADYSLLFLIIIIIIIALAVIIMRRRHGR